MKKIGIACDHAGYELKELLAGFLTARGWEVLDFGTYSPESVDYPDYAHALGAAVESGEVACGVGICGSGEGMAITLNKHQGIRAALCWTPELAALARQHNDANVLVLPGRFIDPATAIAVVDTFLSTSFEGGRHEARIAKIPVKSQAASC